MAKKDVRWKQRFRNFEKAFIYFERAVEIEKYSDLEASGLVQAFEFTFELGWKTLKDYLYEMGTVTNFARDTIKESFKGKLIEDGHAWIEMLENRNELSHTYNNKTAKKAVKIIRKKYYPAIRQVYQFLKTEKKK
ncbi:MAG: nucleotidyltransferase substrate binding protein [Bacteroidetes bacterium]|nr:nucleotidyltransferase substrate binding protein [Bacteroidota bacterium]